MYCQPFGDAFLLTLYSGSEPHHVLIDCGVLHRVQQERKWAQDIVRDVAHTTGGHLDVLIATHMHWDHVSAFSEARDAFSGMAIDEVWLPWTEQPADAAAIRHRRLRTLQLEAVRRARMLLATSRDLGSRTSRAAETKLDQMLAFYGPSTDGTERLEDARNTLFSLGPAPRFLEGGMLVVPARLPALRAYVLGPARDETLLGFEGHGRDRGFYAAVLERAEPGRDVGVDIEMTQPFDVGQRSTEPWRRENPLVRGVIDSYENPAQSWRRIDDDWLLYGTEIAEHLHDTGNDLSLALAIELAGSGEVLLFAGDAPTGRWQSFEWKPNHIDAAQVTVQQLLARTVFYKVPDHGSHRSVDVHSVEGMTRPDLVAAITADRDFARTLGLEMPAASVLARLRERAQGRLLVPQPDNAIDTTARISPSDPSFLKRLTVTALYMDFVIP